MTPPDRRRADDEEEEPPEEVEVPPFEYEVRSSGGAANLILRCDACEGPDALADPRCLAAVLQALGEEYHVDLLTLSGRTMRQFSSETVQLLRQVLGLQKLLQQLATRPPQPLLDGIVIPGADLDDLLEDLYRQADLEAARAPVDDEEAEEEKEEELRRVLGPGARRTPPTPPPVRPSSEATTAPDPLGRAGPTAPPPRATSFPSRSSAPPSGSVAPSPGSTPQELPLEEKISTVETNRGNLQRRLKRLDCATCAFNPRMFFPELEESLRIGWPEFLDDLKEKVQVLGTGRPDEECVRCLGVTVSDLELVSHELSELVSKVRGGSSTSRGKAAGRGGPTSASSSSPSSPSPPPGASTPGRGSS
ncbi:MAG: hypothetical protein KGJ23_09845 [Euryarchaeota archaeon]|nr:hypothetical protein [Euryarchaeota archaeon]MDE1836905.1 hypothetical protein [Euryarchaeota archaeon]MDE1882171.1 hypothetical protein [Euryarchaeota archaeon]MDE2045308.1 hypothetical protein [Thermoplasmata archaeon]